MARIGSDSGLVANNSGGVFDDSGNPIVTADTQFGASPLGIAARSQALYFLPNPSFNILPPEPSSPIEDNANALPYWSVEDLSEGRMTATTVFDETAQTWALEVNPTAGSATDSIAIKTRSYLLNDSNFDLRQKALASLEKVNAYSSTSQWALTLSAEYFDATGSSLSSYSIGTVADNTTWTSLSGFTTSGTAIVDAAAQYVDLTFTLTTTAAVTSTVKVHINSVLLQTSTAGGGGGSQSFLIAETFTSSASWVRPTGIDYLVALVGSGGGGGGGGGALHAANQSGTAFTGTPFVTGGGGGYGANWFLIKDLYVANLGTVSIGVGAAGAAGTSVSFSKALGTAPNRGTIPGGPGASGGNSTFGAIVTIAGGTGGDGGQVESQSPSPGGTPGTTSTIAYGGTFFYGGLGGEPGSNASTAIPRSGGTVSLNAFSLIPYTSQVAALGANGGAAAGTGGTRSVSAPGTSSTAGLWGGGGGGGGARVIGSTRTVNNTAGTGRNGGGSGGASVAITLGGTAVTTGTAGNGGAGTAYGGGGGGGGIAVYGTDANWSATTLSLQSGAGASGSTGFITIVYIA